MRGRHTAPRVCRNGAILFVAVRPLVLRRKASTKVAYWSRPVFVLITIWVNGGWAAPCLDASAHARTHACSHAHARTQHARTHARTAQKSEPWARPCGAPAQSVGHRAAAPPLSVFFIITKGAKNISQLSWDQVGGLALGPGGWACRGVEHSE